MLVKRKLINRIPKNSAFAFLAEFKPGAFALAYRRETLVTTFFNIFLDQYDATIPDVAWQKPLFSASIMPPFFRMNNIYKVDAPKDFCIEDIDLPKFILRPRENPKYLAGATIWDGEWHLRGADLVEIENPNRSLSVQSAPFQVATKEDLNCKNDLEIIQKYPITPLHVSGELCERLEMCRILGKEFDPYKYRIFPDCAELDVEGLARNSSFFNKHTIALLGLVFDESENRWVRS